MFTLGSALERLRTQKSLLSYALLVVIFFVTQKYVWRSLYRIKDPGLEASFFFWTALSGVGDYAVLALCLVAFFIGRRVRWTDTDGGHRLRFLTMSIFGTFGFYFIFAPYSFYFDSAFLSERLFFLAALTGLWFRPSLAPLMLMVSLISLSPQRWGIGALGLTDKNLLIDAAILLATWLGLGPIIKWSPQTLFAALLSVLGASYFFPATRKIILSPHYTEWIFENKIAIKLSRC